MKNLKEQLIHLVVLVIFVLVNVSLLAQTKPSDEDVFDLVMYEDSTGVKFKNGNESVGYLRMPGNGDFSYHIFTNKKYLRLSREKELSIKLSDNDSFYGFIGKDDSTFKEVKNSDIEFGVKHSQVAYYKIQETPIKLIVQDKPYNFKFADASDTDIKTFKVKISDKSCSWGDTLSFYVGDTLENIVICRERRSFIDSVMFDGEKLSGNYNVYLAEKKSLLSDDIIATKASFIVNKKIIPNNADCCSLNVYFRCLENGSIKSMVETVIIKVKLEEKVVPPSEKTGIPLWLYITLAVAIVAVALIWIIVKIVSGRVDRNPAGNLKTETVFEKISNDEAAKLLKEFCGEECICLDYDELRKKSKNLWVKKFCVEWNKQCGDSDFKIGEDKFTEEFVFKNLESWKKQASDDAYKDGGNDVKENYVKNIEKLNCENLELQQKCIKAIDDIQVILKKMTEFHYFVKTVSINTITEGLRTIEQAIEEGVQQDKLQNDIKDLRDQLELQKENYEKRLAEIENNHREQINEKENAHQQELDRVDKEHKITIENHLYVQKENYEKRLAEIENNHREQINEKENAHQQELNRVDKEHAETVGNLNKTIETNNDRIEQLLTDRYQDRNSFVNMVNEQMNRVGEQLNELYENVWQVSGEQATQYTNIVRNAKDDYERFANKVIADVAEKWKQDGISLIQICENLQEYIMPGLSYSGWVNIMHYLNLYAGASVRLNDNFNENGLSTVKLAKLVADIQRLLGMFGVMVVVPHLLIDMFDNSAFEYENADRWIQAFDPSLIPNNYRERIFDMSEIGFQMNNNNYNRPKVYYI